MSATEKSIRIVVRILADMLAKVSKYLHGLDSKDIERRLGHVAHPISGQPVLDLLKEPEPGKTQAEAAQTLLDELATNARGLTLDIALVWRYVQIHQLWNTHQINGLRSAHGFMASLSEQQAVRAFVIFGTSTQRDRDRYIAIIDAKWGRDWYNRVPDEIKPLKRGMRVIDKADLSKPILEQLVGNCRSDLTFEAAQTGWRKALHERTDPERRKSQGSRMLTTPTLITSDIESVNPLPIGLNKGRRPAERYAPDIKEQEWIIQKPEKAKQWRPRPRACKESPPPRPRKKRKTMSPTRHSRRSEEITADGRFVVTRIGTEVINKRPNPDYVSDDKGGTSSPNNDTPEPGHDDKTARDAAPGESPRYRSPPLSSQVPSPEPLVVDEARPAAAQTRAPSSGSHVDSEQNNADDAEHGVMVVTQAGVSAVTSGPTVYDETRQHEQPPPGAGVGEPVAMASPVESPDATSRVADGPKPSHSETCRKSDIASTFKDLANMMANRQSKDEDAPDIYTVIENMSCEACSQDLGGLGELLLQWLEQYD